jgi:acyl carrier protein
MRVPADSNHDAGHLVRQVILRLRSSALTASDLSDELPLGPEGLGLDSVAVVELLLECETVFGVKFPPEVVEGAPMTVARLVSIVDRAMSERDGAAPA